MVNDPNTVVHASGSETGWRPGMRSLARPRPSADVSVIIPFRNRADFLGEALASVAAQTVQPREVIAIDDGSTDDSVEVIRRSGLVVKVVSCDHGNAGLARNEGARLASGEWLAFLDADDVWEPTHLAVAQAALAGTGDVAFTGYHEFLQGGRRREMPARLRPRFKGLRSGLTREDFLKWVLEGFHFGHSTVLMRRELFLELGGFEGSQRRRHDIDLWLRVLGQGTWAYDTHAHAQYRIDTPGSISGHTVEAEYYFVRALVRNRGPVTPAMRALLRKASGKAIRVAITDGTPAEVERAWALAGPFASAATRCVLGAATLQPRAFRALDARRRTARDRLRAVGEHLHVGLAGRHG